MKELRIATFSRGSTNKQTNRGKVKNSGQLKKLSVREINIDDDLPLQKEMIRKFIDSQPEMNKGIKWIMTEYEYVEAGVSGFHTHASKRKGLNRAFDDAKAGLFDILVIYKLDRFGRRSVESLNHAIKFLKYCRIWVVDKNREFTNNGDADEILNFIEFWSAKKSSMDTKIRVTDAMRLIHNEGYWTGGNPPYGYINHPEIANMLQVVPKEAEIVKQIYQMYTDDGFGMLKIAGILNERGEKTKLGNVWKSDNIRKILRNTVYKGYLSYGKTCTTEGEFGAYQKYIKEGEEAISDRYWSEYDIVGEELWEKAQRIKKSRSDSDNAFGQKTPSRAGTGKGLLVGILKCECGANMTYSTSSNWLDRERTKRGEPYGVYRCLLRLKSGAAACGAKKGMYKSEEIENAVLETISSYIDSMITNNLINEIRKKSVKAGGDMSDKLKSAKFEIERWTKARDNSNAELTKILMGEHSAFSREQLAELYEKSSGELSKAKRFCAELESNIGKCNVSQADALKMEDLLSNWSDIYRNATTQIKRQMIRAVVNEVHLKGKEINVEIAFDITAL